MNIIKFLDQFSNVDLNAVPTSRRDLFGTLGSMGKKAALAAVPFSMATTKTKAASMMYYGHIEEPALSALKLALTLEYLEATFYNKTLISNVLPSGRPQDVYEQIADHENAHVTLLESVLMITNDTRMIPNFDFTLDGALDPFNERGSGKETAYKHSLLLAQAFEDTGVRAYKGQAGNLQFTPYLAPALRIHSVEARHAAEVRRLRSAVYNKRLDDDGLGWITLNNQINVFPDPTVPPEVYAGEQEIVQAGVNLTSLGDTYSPESASQSFDEPITAREAVAIATPFFA